MLCVLAVLFSLGVGRFFIPPDTVFGIIIGQWFPVEQTWDALAQNVVLNTRMPRVLGALLVGAALSLSGATYQGIFKNPLVSPDLLGVSSGACVGASLAIMAHTGALGIQVAAFSCGIVAVLLSVAISKLFRQDSALALVLSGIVVGGLFSAVLSLCQYVANVYEELAQIVFWTMGSVKFVDAVDLWTLLPVIVVFGGILIALRWRVNLLSLGESEASTLGVNVKLLRGLTIVCSTALTACAVSITGSIGWIGLIIPHVGRLVVGSDNNFLLPASALLGGLFLVVVDTLARNLSSSEIPLSIITGILGAALFVAIIARRRMQL
ncbi:MAG: iron ABC transporter permease [Coriobacteriales bacterium]|nr:iron ABC transporter permease [Coriobacteriales bacterium]